jgi:hypothetical protein
MWYSSVLPLRCPLITNRPFDGVYAWASSLKTQSILLIRVIIVFDVYLISIFSRKRVHRVAKETDWEMCALWIQIAAFSKKPNSGLWLLQKWSQKWSLFTDVFVLALFRFCYFLSHILHHCYAIILLTHLCALTYQCRQLWVLPPVHCRWEKTDRIQFGVFFLHSITQRE